MHLPKHRYDTKLHEPKKSGASIFWLDLTWLMRRCHGIPCVYFFCLEPPLGKDNWMRASSTTVMVFFSWTVPFWKLLDHNYIQSSFWRIEKPLKRAFWKKSLYWRFYGHGSRYMLILSSRLEQTLWNGTNEGALEIVTYKKKIRLLTSKNIAPK